MEVLLVLVPFLVAGIVVIFIAFSGSPGAAREAYLTRGGRVFTFVDPADLRRLGIAVPAAVIASQRRGGGRRRAACAPRRLSTSTEEGKTLFIETCKSCHTLAPVQAHGVTGPDLDELGELDKQRVLNAIKSGGTGQDRMPTGLLQGEDAAEGRGLRVAGRGPVARSRKLPEDAALFPSGPCAVLLAWPRPSKPKPRPERGVGEPVGRPARGESVDPRGCRKRTSRLP